MIVEMEAGASKEELDSVVKKIKSLGLDIHLNLGTDKTVIAILGSDTGRLPTDIFAAFPRSVFIIGKPLLGLLAH